MQDTPYNRRLFLAKTLRSTLLVASLAATYASIVSALDIKPTYSASMRDENLEFTKKFMSKYYAGLIKEVAEVRSGVIPEVIYGGNAERRGNFVVSIFSERPPHPDAAVTNASYKKVTSMSGAKARQKRPNCAHVPGKCCR